jgi:hypothetical protein
LCQERRGVFKNMTYIASDRVDILSGIEAGEPVAVTALSKLFDGAKVDIKKD